MTNATLDAQDRLVAADADLAALNERAGGAIGAILAVPQLATIVRLARRLRILVARSVTIADGDVDLECWVRATPIETGVTLALSIVRERPAWRPVGGAARDVPPPPAAAWTWETDAALRLTRIAPGAGARYGFDAATALGRPLTRLFALDTAGDGALPLLEAVAARENFDRQPGTMRETGRRVTLAGNVRCHADGAFAGFVGGTFDVPDGIAPASALPLDTKLEGILRGPLGRIIANADSIHAAGEGPIDPHYADYAADIASAGRHLMALVDDLSDLEAIERPGFAIAGERLDMADVARRAAGLLGVRAADAGVTIDRADLDRPLYARADFRRVLQILVNLMSNAVRYSPRDATIWLRLQQDGDRIVTIVADQGKGIGPEDHDRVFAKFERIDTTEPGGSGLGLYIARRLARAMGGDLTVDSAPGQGARFVLTLPAG